MCQQFAPKPLAASARRGWRELVCLDPKRQRLCSPKRFDSFESPSPTAMWCAATCPCPASGARHSKPTGRCRHHGHHQRDGGPALSWRLRYAIERPCSSSAGRGLPGYDQLPTFTSRCVRQPASRMLISWKKSARRQPLETGGTPKPKSGQRAGETARADDPEAHGGSATA